MKLLWLLALFISTEYSLQGKQFFLSDHIEFLHNCDDHYHVIKPAFKQFADTCKQKISFSNCVQSHEIKTLFACDNFCSEIVQAKQLMLCCFYTYFFSKIVPQLSHTLQSLHTYQDNLEVLLLQKYSIYNEQNLIEKLSVSFEIENQLAAQLGRCLCMQHVVKGTSDLDSIGNVVDHLYSLNPIVDDGNLVERFMFFVKQTMQLQSQAQELCSTDAWMQTIKKVGGLSILGLLAIKVALIWKQQHSSARTSADFEQLYAHAQYELIGLHSALDKKNKQINTLEQHIQLLKKDVSLLQAFPEPLVLDDVHYQVRQRQIQRVADQSVQVINQKASGIVASFKDTAYEGFDSVVEGITGKNCLQIQHVLQVTQDQLVQLFNTITDIDVIELAKKWGSLYGLLYISRMYFFDQHEQSRVAYRCMHAINRLLNKALELTEIDFVIEGQLFSYVQQLESLLRDGEGFESLTVHRYIQDLMSVEMNYHQKKNSIESLIQHIMVEKIG